MTIGQVLKRSACCSTQDFAEIEFPARFEDGLAEALGATPMRAPILLRA